MNKERIFELKIKNPSCSYDYLRTKIEELLGRSLIDYDKIVFSESRIKKDENVRETKNNEKN